MSSVDRLLIQGIRSFGPEERDKAVIRFSTPLTLILGQNGCGKTTIIEALKYATCNELPAGTDSGSGFLHDPKLCGCIDVKGHVKLKFTNVKGQERVIARTAQVTQKARKLEFKTLDATVTNEQGESLSASRCIDVDSYMQNALGVSKAVLTNVIFCHQEDSGWPLEKGKKMKERFDAIFGITEYNRCLDYMRQLAKKFDTEKVVAKKDVDINQLMWTDTTKKIEKLESSKASLSASCDEITKLENELTPLKNKLDEILDKEMNLVKHYTKIQTIKGKREMLKENQKDLRKRIKDEFLGSTAELSEKIRNFEEDLRGEKAKLKKLEEDKDLVNREEIRHQKNISTKQMQLGTFQNEKSQNDERVGSRNLSMNKLADELKLTVVSSCDMNQDRASQLLHSIEQKLKDENRALEKTQEEWELEEKKLQNDIDLTREKKVGMEHGIQIKQKNIDDNKNETARIEQRIKDVDKSAETLATLEKKLAEVDKELEKVTNSLDVNQCNTRISENTSKRNKLESKLSELSEEIKTLQKFSVFRATLDQHLERKRKLEDNFNTLKEKHISSFRHLLNDVPENNFKNKVQSCLDRISTEIRTKNNLIADKEKQLAILTEKKSNLESQVLLKKRKLADDEDLILDCCADGNLEAHLKKLEDRVAEAQDNKGGFTSSLFLFRRYATKLKSDNPICPVCKRDFSGPEELDSIVADIEKRVRELPASVAKADKDVKEAIEEQTQAIQLLPLFKNISRMKDEELPKLKKEVDEMKNKVETLKSEIQTLNDELTEPLADQNIANSLLSDCTTLDHLYQELKKLQQDIETQEKKMPAAGMGRTIQQANDEEDDVKKQLNACRKVLESTQNDLSRYHEQMNKLRERRNVFVTEQMKTKGNVQQRKELCDKLENLQMTSVLYEKELEDLEKNLIPETEKLTSLSSELRKMKIDHKIKFDEKKQKLNEYDKKHFEISSLHRAIEEYNAKGGASKLDKIRQELTELQLTKEENAREKERIEKEIQTINQLLQAGEMKKMDFENNLNFRQKQEEISNLEKQIIELEGQTGELTVESLKRQKIKTTESIGRLEGQKNLVKGRQLELQKSIRESEFELNKEEHKNAEQNYRRSVVSLKILTLAIEDLKQYEKAMDWAMIYFHKERMQMINKIVRTLWRQIYRGNDIDDIEIKTDETQSGTGARRSYNYRVVQNKAGVELDMPGRCSAGQKVLACLIIRMALAETFSKNCGILTLDEPTTNLDRENIEALSLALRDIVTKRMIQKNFQLIIITHDEEFLNILTRSEKVDHYLKVQRNHRGKSEVQKIKV